MDEVFAPPAESWQTLSPKYKTVRRIVALVSCAIFWGVLTAAVWLLSDWRWGTSVLAVGLGWTIWRVERVGRWWKRWGYAERADDLYVTHGLWFRQLTAVPYGRMQIVKVESGPIERALGLASVTLVTASAHTDARIPGLPALDAARLRDRLTELGEAHSSGL